jgi:hypothetical protein
MTSPLLYEINTRCWLRELSDRSRRRITLADVPDSEFAAWVRWGFTHIWLMGVWTVGDQARACAQASPQQREVYAQILPDWTGDDVAGSPYAIADYVVSPALGGDEALARFRESLHRRGLKLLLDFVPNHVGLDHPWVRERPELFVQSAQPVAGTFEQETDSGRRFLAHGRDPYFPPWTDTVQIDYRNPEARAAMLEVLQRIASRCDGVRCDMAMLVLQDVFERTWSQFPVLSLPGEFWPEAIGSIKQARPGFLLLAEAYWGLEPRLQALGFDYTYDKGLYDGLVARDPTAVQRHLAQTSVECLVRGAHFLENHDEPRIASLLSLPEHRAAALLILGLPGIRFLHEGQLEGATCRVPVQLARRPVEPTQPAVAAMYEELLTALAVSRVGQGQGELLKVQKTGASEDSLQQDIVTVRWQGGQPGLDLVAVNLTAHPSDGWAPLGTPNSALHWMVKEQLGGDCRTETRVAIREGGIHVRLPPHGAELVQMLPES